jgi:hypothetical protein
MKWQIFLSVALAIVLAACQKQNDEATLQLREETANEAELEAMSYEIAAIGEEAIESEALTGQFPPMTEGLLPPCALLTYDTTGNERVLTIDFGTTGCTGRDGRTRFGKIEITAENFGLDPLSTRNIRLIQYKVDSFLVEGTIKQTVLRQLNQLIREVSLDEDLTIKNKQSNATYGRRAVIQRIFDFARPGLPLSGTIISWGTVVLQLPSGRKLTRTVLLEEALVYTMPCRRIVRGIARFTNEENQTWTLDFGDGRCDNLAQWSNGRRQITIRIR